MHLFKRGSSRVPWAELDAVLARAGAVSDQPPELLAIWMFYARAGRALRAFGAQALAASHLDASDFAILAALWFRDEPFRATPSALARNVGLSQSGTARALQRLAARGTIVKLTHPADGRATFVELTDDGRALVERLVRSLMDGLATALDAGPDAADDETVDVGQVAVAAAGLLDALEHAPPARLEPAPVDRQRQRERVPLGPAAP